MNDTSQSAGWWLDSDGKWYPPELAPSLRPPPPPPQQQQQQQQQQTGQAAALAQRPASITPHWAPTSSQPSTEAGTMPTKCAAHTDTMPQIALVSDASQGQGWWEGMDGKWYAPEVYPSNTPQGDGWWPAPDGKWYAPMFHPSYVSRSASDVFLGEGWWQGTDGKWYAPELHPSDRPRGDDWWQATNGWWYAPIFHPDSRSVRSAKHVPSHAGVSATTATSDAGVLQTPLNTMPPSESPPAGTIRPPAHPTVPPASTPSRWRYLLNKWLLGTEALCYKEDDDDDK